VTRRLLFYLYGTPHMVGSLAALAGLALYFSGVIGSYWYLIVAGLYGAGALGWPSNREYHLRLDGEASTEEIRETLARVVKSVKGEIPEPIADKVQRIVASIEAVLPRLTHLGKAHHSAYTIRETALAYLPETLENYLRLPKAYRRFHKLEDGRTPQALLIEQLDILEQQMAQVADEVNRDDLDGLKAHGRFLKSRFASSDSFLS